MLRWRLVGAALVLGPLALLIWLDDQRHGGRPGIWLVGFSIVVAILGCREVNQILERALGSVSSRVNLLAVLAVLGAAAVPIAVPSSASPPTLEILRWPILGLALAWAIVFGAELFRYREPGQSTARLAGGALSVFYLAFPLACLLQLRILPVASAAASTSVPSPGRLGLLALFSTLLIVKLSDTGAYLVGRAIGRTKLTRISPGKTWEGLAGGLLFALGGAWLTHGWLLPSWGQTSPAGSPLLFALYGLSLMVAGLAGDLIESVLKRDSQIKDSSHLLPGLGGALDVIDSILAVAPISLAWWASGYLI